MNTHQYQWTTVSYRKASRVHRNLCIFLNELAVLLVLQWLEWSLLQQNKLSHIHTHVMPRNTTKKNAIHSSWQQQQRRKKILVPGTRYTTNHQIHLLLISLVILLVYPNHWFWEHTSTSQSTWQTAGDLSKIQDPISIPCCRLPAFCFVCSPAKTFLGLVHPPPYHGMFCMYVLYVYIHFGPPCL